MKPYKAIRSGYLAIIVTFFHLTIISLSIQACSTTSKPLNHDSSNHPAWVMERITLAKKNPSPVPITIAQYRYRNQTVYYLSPMVADGFSQLFNINHKLICAPEGGITGKGDGQCPNFFQQANNKVILFKKSP